MENERCDWVQCAGIFSNFVENVQQEGAMILSKIKEMDTVNPPTFLLDMVNFLSDVAEKTEKLQKLAQIEVDNFFSEREPLMHQPEERNFDLMVEHDPGKRKICSLKEREFIVKLGPHQPILRPFPCEKEHASAHTHKQKRFNPKWYEEYNFLEYSICKDAAFCFVCSLFPTGVDRSQSESAWTTEGVRKWSSMKSRGQNKKGKLLLHFTSKAHKAALNDYLHFIKEAGRIDILMSKEVRENKIKEEQEKEFNKQIISILFDITKTMARQGLPFRGDGDDKEGNFYQIVQLVGRHNHYLKKWLEETKFRPYKVSYLSKTSHEEFLKILADETRKIILEEVETAEMFSVMADTTPDVSHKDRLVVNLRYVNKEGLPVEKFLNMVELKDKTGEGHAKQILKVLENQVGLGSENLVFQSYDYAKAMSGQFKGAQKKVSDFVGRTIPYVPCQAHRTNTFTEHASNCSSIFKEFFNTLESIYVYFTDSTKKYAALQEELKELENSLQLKNLSKTRWTARAESIKAVRNEFEEIVNVLKKISNSKNEFDTTARSKALGLYKKLLQVDFMACLMFSKNIFFKLKMLTEVLEKQSLNIIDAISLIRSTLNMLKSIREDEDSINLEIAAIMKFARSNGVNPEEDYRLHHRLRKAPKGIDANNQTTADIDCQTFYRREFLALLDVLITSMDENLGKIMEELLPIFETFQTKDHNISLENINRILKMLPKSNKTSTVDAEIIQLEIEHLFQIAQEETETYENFADLLTISEKYKTALPNANTICRFIATAPITTASSERSFSSLKLIKNFLRNKMGDERLDSCLILHIEKEAADRIALPNVLEKWSKLKHRRIHLS